LAPASDCLAGKARLEIGAALLHHSAQLKPIAANAELTVAIHALHGKFDAPGAKAVARMPGHGHAVDHARRAVKRIGN
jgi:hypothetical protein